MGGEELEEELRVLELDDQRILDLVSCKAGATPRPVSRGQHIRFEFHGLDAVEALLPHARPEHKGRQQQRLRDFKLHVYRRVPHNW